MINVISYRWLILFIFVFVCVSDYFIRLNSFIGISNGSTLIILLSKFLSIVLLSFIFLKTYRRDCLPKVASIVFLVMLGWQFIVVLRGAGNVQGYWEWKVLLLQSIPIMFSPLFLIVGLRFDLADKLFLFIFKLLLIGSLILIPYTLKVDYEAFSRSVLIVYVCVLFIPILPKRWRIIVTSVALLSLFMDITYRSNALRILIPFALLLFYLFYRLDTKIYNKFLNVIAVFVLITPLVFLWLGYSGQFNIFQDKIVDISYESGGSSNLSATNNLDADTRTFLYQEVFWSMDKNDSSYLFGQGAASGYESDYFIESELSDAGRFFSEVGFLNTLLHSGIIGVVFYCCILFLAVFYGINRSNNSLTALFSILLMFHWLLFFVESVPKYDALTFSIWFLIGLCLSNKFRSLEIDALKEFFSTHVFDRKITVKWR
ncbi:MAG: hypothetical protein ACJA2G_001640 [Cognaticolwellia sp.]|jgi:hypothetical protein